MKKKTRYYIKPPQNIGRRAFVMDGIILWLLLDRIHLPHWITIIYVVVFILLFLALIYDLITVEEKEVDVQRLLRFEKQVNESNKEVEVLKKKVRVPTIENPPPLTTKMGAVK